MILERLGASNLFGEEILGVMHIFDVKELDRYLSEVGFKGFAHNIYGPYIPSHAEKG